MDIENRGKKNLCPNCGTKFYDLNRLEIICPNCNFKIEFNENNTSKKDIEKQKLSEINLNEEVDFEDEFTDTIENNIIDIKKGP